MCAAVKCLQPLQIAVKCVALIILTHLTVIFIFRVVYAGFYVLSFSMKIMLVPILFTFLK